MGQLVDGNWEIEELGSRVKDGRFKRPDSSFRHWLTHDGSAGPTGDAGFRAEPGRYHLYISYACPWAHRALIFRKLQRLEQAIGLTVVDATMAEEGWTMRGLDADTLPDTVNGKERLYEVYTAAKADYTGRVTVPVLWDTKTDTIVNNESAEIIRMFNSAFDELARRGESYGNPELDFYPEELRGEIDAVNERVYHTVNNGVYKTGFASATNQAAYDENCAALFDTLDVLEERLGRQRYLVGERLTEADWRLFVTLVRFDAVYVTHFRCNLRRLTDYPNLWGHTRELYQMPGIAETVNLRHIKKHYFTSMRFLNPGGVIPVGLEPRLDVPHDRDRF